MESIRASDMEPDLAFQCTLPSEKLMWTVTVDVSRVKITYLAVIWSDIDSIN